MPYGIKLPGDAWDWARGMVGHMIDPYVQFAKDEYGAYQEAVNDAYNWGMQPVGPPTPDYVSGAEPQGPAPGAMQLPPGHSPNFNPYQPPVQSQVQIPPMGSAPQPPGPPPMSGSIQPLPDPGMAGGMQPPELVPEMVVPPGPTPMEQWMTNYNDETARAQAEMKRATRLATIGQMGSSLLAAPNWAEGIAGMDPSAISRGSVSREAYGQERENSKLDSLYRMEQIRRSQEPRQASTRPQVLQDGTVIKWVGDQPYKVGAGGSLNPIGLDELGGLHEAAEENERDEKVDAKLEVKHAEWVQQREQAKLKGEEYYEYWLGRPENVEPIRPGRGPGPQKVQSPSLAKSQADMIREDIRTNPELRKHPNYAEESARYLEMNDEDLVAAYNKRHDV